uniref:Putative complexin-1 n=1 Tax=Heterorhabditis bacteriophora TaxID=37862 RepID=A0A1I7W720_HETBA
MASTNTTNLMLNGLGLDTQQFSEMFKALLLGGLDKLTGENEDGTEKSEIGEDPEVIAARLEQEERRKEKHRKMEEEREKMRQNIRAKYNIKKKEQQIPGNQFVEGRIGGPKKVPEQVEQTAENSTFI